MSKFDKVSESQYVISCGIANNSQSLIDYNDIVIPNRSTSGAAGYDFYSPADYMIGATPVLIPTGIRCKLNHGSFLMIVPRSSMGFKYGMQLVNTAGIIDEDYYHSDNEGHIMIKVKSDIPFMIHKGDRFAQGIILPYGVVSNDNANNTRNGGMGSTGK